LEVEVSSKFSVFSLHIRLFLREYKMSKPSSRRPVLSKDRQAKPLETLRNESEQPRNSALHMSLSQGRRDRLQDSPLDHAHDAKQSGRALRVIARLRSQGHRTKPNSEDTSPWMLEHRWPHMRDRAAGRNHGVDGR
jgi:hypothetical protein